jgi:hypothetical protein
MLRPCSIFQTKLIIYSQFSNTRLGEEVGSDTNYLKSQQTLYFKCSVKQDCHIFTFQPHVGFQATGISSMLTKT